ncbi:C25 family cysteine peptidase [Saccharopolyspora spinosa]|uniref:Peptidase C25-like protein n=1 Tax=Saccharopolyspora spinosa TaxID=60894 RepID=A0A2N3Y8G9_SACSN|nr:C25 family cysteine peptidase [Saccharopolyspora spinosa]PKW19200.1 peptidase C25-like protein [Saccharopolyspora spinosa]
MAIKIIVTNYSALRNKGYTESGIKSIQKELAALIKADKDRGITTTVVDVSNNDDVAHHNAPVVTSEKDEKQSKDTIDKVFHSAKPDYLMILGSSDVIPHQTLNNPHTNHHESSDVDLTVPSDLPYASETSYGDGGKEAKNYNNPSRVVGRLPDLTDGHDLAHLVRLIQLAAKSVPSPRKEYDNYFGLSAEVWKEGSARDLTYLFGNSTALHLVPPETSPWKPPTPLGALIHFVSCHGTFSNPEWFGESKDGGGNEIPPLAMASDDIKQNITYGTIAAPQCCYGAELFSTKTSPGIPLCSTYLDNGATAFFGSTNVAFAQQGSCKYADLITRTFIEEALKGQSIGYAALKAQQDYVKQNSSLNPFSLKTLAQFILLGDPSLKPVELPPQVAETDTQSATADRRRQALIAARTLERGVSVPVAITEARISPEFETVLREVGQQHDFPSDASLSSYDEVWQGDSATVEGTGQPPRQHVLYAVRDPSAPVRTDIALIIREQQGAILSVEKLHAV